MAFSSCLRPLSAFGLLLASIASGGCSGDTTCFCGPTQANPLDAESDAIVQQVNLTRMATPGLTTVTVCDSLNVSAAGHSDQMRDDDYLAEVSPVDGSDVRSRACKAGYAPGCTSTTKMAELVAEGNGTAASTYAQWTGNSSSAAILTTPGFVVVGMGHSIGATNEYWTLDLSAKDDPSCD